MGVLDVSTLLNKRGRNLLGCYDGELKNQDGSTEREETGRRTEIERDKDLLSLSIKIRRSLIL